ncbi:putative BsuMI modification methylase subunit YdiO [Spiroplasma sp. JKS002671]|uniref:DNA cytosine methyltransferase n=1 Tax=Spiroplasma attinicola TaxID=2904537 RepID=UPI002022ADDB|nr:DNA (cytosine-5-)-methyltransferase [Spiroplasma sp. JKS002671]MCL8210639.1 putative BsuMI modification methylase subunit YdiO [Spiroplasma sp. JKS002671]
MVKGISLFSNVGIDEYYLEEAGIKIVLANELIKKRADFYSHLYNDSEMITGDITKPEIFSKLVQKSREKKINFLLATPPCQGFSVAGKMDKNDKRNELIKYVVKFVKETMPDNILIENVPGFLKFKLKIDDSYILIKNYIIDSFSKLGYFVNFKILDAADYKTPQFRKRVIFLISKNKNWEFPKKNPWITVRDAISDLPSLESGMSSKIKYHFAKNHNKRHIKWMQYTPTGCSAHNNEKYFPQKNDKTKIKGYATTYKRIDWDKPAPTITMANGSVSSQNNVHPGKLTNKGLYSDARVLTILELLRLTGLPDDWNIPEWASDKLIREVLGECFPPKFALEIVKNMPN